MFPEMISPSASSSGWQMLGCQNAPYCNRFIGKHVCELHCAQTCVSCLPETTCKCYSPKHIVLTDLIESEKLSSIVHQDMWFLMFAHCIHIDAQRTLLLAENWTRFLISAPKLMGIFCKFLSVSFVGEMKTFCCLKTCSLILADEQKFILNRCCQIQHLLLAIHFFLSPRNRQTNFLQCSNWFIQTKATEHCFCHSTTTTLMSVSVVTDVDGLLLSLHLPQSGEEIGFGF